LSESAYVIRALERSGDLNRSLNSAEEEEIAERLKAGEGLTRRNSHHLELRQDLAVPGAHPFQRSRDPILSTELARYFPTPVQKRFRRDEADRLRREIIATAITIV